MATLRDDLIKLASLYGTPKVQNYINAMAPAGNNDAQRLFGSATPAPAASPLPTKPPAVTNAAPRMSAPTAVAKAPRAQGYINAMAPAGNNDAQRLFGTN